LSREVALNRAGASLIAIWLTLCCAFVLQIVDRMELRFVPPPPPGGRWWRDAPPPYFAIQMERTGCEPGQSTSIAFRRVPEGWLSDSVETRGPGGTVARANPLVLVTDAQLARLRRALLEGRDCTDSFDERGFMRAPLPAAITDDALARVGLSRESWAAHADEAIDAVVRLSGTRRNPAPRLARGAVAASLDADLVARLLIEHVYAERGLHGGFGGVAVECFIPGDPPMSARTSSDGPWMLPWEVRIGTQRRLACSPEISERLGAILANCRVPGDHVGGENEVHGSAVLLRGNGLHASSPWLGDAFWSYVGMRLREVDMTGAPAGAP
jgi:hypothetical protein